MIDIIIGFIIGVLFWQFVILIICLLSHDNHTACFWGIGLWQLVCFVISIPIYFVKKWRNKSR